MLVSQVGVPDHPAPISTTLPSAHASSNVLAVASTQVAAAPPAQLGKWVTLLTAHLGDTYSGSSKLPSVLRVLDDGRHRGAKRRGADRQPARGATQGRLPVLVISRSLMPGVGACPGTWVTLTGPPAAG